MLFKPTKIRLDREAACTPLAQLLKSSNQGKPASPKETLHLTINKGAAVRPCPGTKEYICCGYQILHVGTGCPMDCSYCILQAYLEDQELKLFAPWDHLTGALEELSRLHPHMLFRLGTGEFTDSLYLDHLTHFTRFIAPHVQRTPNLVLEFKTKTANVENLLQLENTDRLIVSFSLNTRRIVKQEERRTASLARRLEAARRCQDRGFALGFHFDPLINYSGWQDDYGEVVDRLFQDLDPERIIWISLGCLRFMPRLKNIIKQRFPQSNIIYNEFIMGLDGKMRYFRPIRVEMYRFMEQAIKARAPKVFTYLCMESDEIWRKAMGRSPRDSRGLGKWLDQRTKDFFPSLNTV